MIRKWKKDLVAWGFTASGGQNYFRETSAFFLWINETALGEGKKEVRLNLSVNIKDPFLDDRGFGLLCLWGEVTPAGIFVNFDDSPYWIAPSEEGAVYQVLARCQRFWFEHWGDEEHLIAYLQHPVPTVATAWKPGDKDPTLRSVSGVVSRHRPIVDYWLSLLHYHRGAPMASLACAEKWLRHVEHLQDGGSEPTRTQRQIATLSATL